MKVHFLNFSYDRKDNANFDNALPIIMKNFPEPIGLETNTVVHYRTITNLKIVGWTSEISKSIEQKS